MFLPRLVLVVGLLGWVLPVTAQQAIPAALPLQVADADWHPLREQVDPFLQERLAQRLNEHPQWAALIRDKKMAVGLVDLREVDDPRFARVNGNEMLYAASLPKIAILLTAMHGLEEGTVEETPEVLADLNAMIRTSSNSAATAMIERAGGFEQIEAVMTDPRYALYDPAYGGGLWVGKAYAKTGERHPDPIEGLSHGATVSQVCRFYYLMATGRLVSRARSRQMLEIMADPGINHKFVNQLSARAPRARLFRKSGTWRNWHSDSVLVWGPTWRRYILVGLIEDPGGEAILRELVPVVEQVLRASPEATVSEFE